MSTHRFEVGDRIKLKMTMPLQRSLAFEVIRLLPPERDDFPPRYLVKSKDEPYSRTVDEAQVAGLMFAADVMFPAAGITRLGR